MALDPDIQAATEAELEKIKVQDQRVANAQLSLNRTSFNQTLKELIDWLKSEYAKLPPENSFRHALTLAIADKYMTTSTAIDPALVLADAQKDAARLKAAVDEVLKTL